MTGALGELFAGAFLATPFHSFLARDLVEREAAREPKEGDMRAQPVALETAVRAALDGIIVHAPSVGTILKAAHHSRRAQ